MATRNPADTTQPNFRGCDWYEPYLKKTAQNPPIVYAPLTSDVIYGHGTWDEQNQEFVPGTPIQVEYPGD